MRKRVAAREPTFSLATESDVAAIVSVRNAVADHLTQQYGRGHWSHAVTEKSVLFNLKTSKVLVAHDGKQLIATLRLATKKPWAIDKTYFTACKKPLYLTDMAVTPSRQRTGIGRLLLGEAIRIAKEWPADAIRLDAYDAEAGAVEFYRKYSFRECGRVVYRKVPLVYFEKLI